MQQQNLSTGWAIKNHLCLQHFKGISYEIYGGSLSSILKKNLLLVDS